LAGRLPNFLFIGADKAGSTWLFRVLQAHPACFVPPAKDIYFFDRHYGRGLDWYVSFFGQARPDALAVGELSHDYLYSDAAAERIARDLPGVKIVVFLRDPVARTFSEYLYLVRSGLVRDVGVRAAVAENAEPVDHSRYARFLPSYLDRFPRDDVGIFLYEDLERAPTSFAGEVLRFLGLDLVDGIDYERRVLGAARPRSRFLARAARGVATATRAAGFPTVVGRAKSSGFTRLLYAQYGEGERPHPTREEEDWLHGQLDPELPALEALLERPLAHWGLDGV
jgi:hypothetical protein